MGDQMIRRVEIERLRGVRSGALESLSRLVVLVGPNGSGKSTILEALLIGATNYPANAIGIGVRHRAHTYDGARWLVWKSGEDGPARVGATRAHLQDSPLEIEREITWDSLLVVPEILKEFAERGVPGPYSAFRIQRRKPEPPNTSSISLTAVTANNLYRAIEIEHDLPPYFVRFVEPRTGDSLHDLFSRAVRSGDRAEIVEIAKAIIPDLEQIEILTEESSPRLFLTYKSGAVPATLAGDGTQALLRTLFELASRKSGTVLLEEPEVHLHPALLKESARAILTAVRRGTQIVMATHSLELIQGILSQLSDAEINDGGFLSVIRTRLTAGTLTTTSLAAKDAERATAELNEDLR